ncbi:MAG TPA: SMC family ATPase [Candidatus Dormibacteraeota bacterium]|nr:SMC family ATPase [Candidatus Dormibacteraeota bacterium]
MRLESIRLKNIKSYGEGPEGAGVTIRFEPGVNRVAGRNGHGKTTIIEALGYALFFCEPEHEENFKLQAYFLRAGEKEAEIDVCFSHIGHRYRVERALGQSKRRSKVVSLVDESTCAEGDEAVAACLCRILRGEDRAFNQRQLADVFSNLVGVKQGRLTWPFDSKPAAAKEFFEPLLDVAIFRESESRLRDARGRFEALLQEHDVKLATVNQRIADRAKSREEVPVKETEVETWRKVVQKSRRLKEEAEKLRLACEQKQAACVSARTALTEADHRHQLALQKGEQETRLLFDAQQAGERLKKTEAGYQAFLKAEAELKLLHQQQTQRSALHAQREKVVKARSDHDFKRNRAQAQVDEIVRQRAEKTTQVAELAKEMQRTISELARLKSECTKLTDELAAAAKLQTGFNAWVENWSVCQQPSSETLSIPGLNLSVLIELRKEEENRAEAVNALERKTNQITHSRQTLAAQLAQISGGVCPFLKEQCRQFDPKAVESDLSSYEKELARVTREHTEAVKKHATARQAVAAGRTKVIQFVEQNVESARSKLQPRSQALVAAERDLENLKRHQNQAQKILQQFDQKSVVLFREIASLQEQGKTTDAELSALDARLATFVRLDEILGEQQKVKGQYSVDYHSHLQNQPLAGKISMLEAGLKRSLELETLAKTQVAANKEAFELANRDFAPEALSRAQEAAAETRSKLARDQRDLETAETNLSKEKERLKEWKAACAERDQIENEAQRLRAATHLSKVAAKILKDAAPAVAQHLCSRIAASAQKIFSQINQEPIELEWKAEPHYSLRVVPGSRRFAMLSGGEQTKLALAMTLAMIQEFSGLHFAVFDEPTYAVDSESRQKLADAILEAQKAAGLEQLIVVSHDDAFEGKIEHVVLLNKMNGATAVQI